MAELPQQAAPPTVPILVAETSDVRPFARLLRGIGLKHNAVMTISKAGFEVTVEEVKSLCAIAWIPINLFQTFEFPDEHLPECFEISLDALLQCLNIFGNAGPGGDRLAAGGNISVAGPGGRGKRRWAGEGDGDDEGDKAWRHARQGNKRTGMRMTWLGPGYPLSVLLRDDARGPVTTCELSTLEPEELMNQTFDDKNRAVYLIMKSEWFRDALLDLPPSCNRVTLRATPRNQNHMPQAANATASSNARALNREDIGNFSVHAQGDFGTVQFDYPNDREIMDAFECKETVVFSYHAVHIALLGRALQYATKICLQIEGTGFLSVQIMMPIPENAAPDMHNGILEFKMNALEDDDD